MKNKILYYVSSLTIFVSIIVIVFNFIIMPNTSPYKNLIRILKDDSIIKKSIGKFERINYIPDTKVDYNDSIGYGEFWIWVYGSKGKCDTYIKIVNKNGEWVKDTIVINKVYIN